VKLVLQSWAAPEFFIEFRMDVERELVFAERLTSIR
jgi:hypothetical protein